MNTFCYAIVTSLLLLISTQTRANIDDVPLPNEFEVRMAMEDKFPMIISGFTKQSIDEVMAFYDEKLGQPEYITDDIGRYTYFYNINGKKVKIGFYQQDDWCELSIMMTE